jgi:hypothetical protein
MSYYRNTGGICRRIIENNLKNPRFMAESREIKKRRKLEIESVRAVRKLFSGKNEHSSERSADLASRQSDLRAKLAASKDPREKVQLSRQLRELRGSVFELVTTLPDLESVRKRIGETKDPREKAILARYAHRLRKNQPTKQIKQK